MTPFQKREKGLYCKIKKKTTIMKIGRGVSVSNRVLLQLTIAFPGK